MSPRSKVQLLCCPARLLSDTRQLLPLSLVSHHHLLQVLGCLKVLGLGRRCLPGGGARCASRGLALDNEGSALLAKVNNAVGNAAGLKGKVGKKTGEDVAGKRGLGLGLSRLLILASATLLIFASTGLLVLLLLSTEDVVLAPLLLSLSLISLLLFTTMLLFVLINLVLAQDLFVNAALDAVQRHGIRRHIEIIMSANKI